MLDVNLKAPEHYINRELSFLDFNQRVLAQAHDERLPLLERIRFLGISCSNLDEFFEIRVAGLKQRQELDSLAGGPDGMTVPEQLVAIHERAAALVKDQYELLHQLVFPALAAENIHFVNAKTLTPEQRKWIGEYFAKEVEPVLTPLGLDPARPFPRIQNKSLNFIVRLSGKDAFGRDTELAVVQVPRSLPRIIRLPPAAGEPGKTYFVFLSAVISTFVAQLFSGMKVEGTWQFRVTRNSDLFVDDEEVDNLLRAIEGELAQRRYGAAVRLETSLDCPEDITNFLLRHFALKRDDLYQVNGPVNLNRLMAIYDLVDRPDLKYPAFTPCIPKRLVGKEVTVIIELMARFDEAANIKLATRLQEAGAHVMYGVVGYKTHAKLIMVVRRESGKLRRYCHCGTGNYHPNTARVYTDYGLFTCDEAMGEDLHELFLQLTSPTRVATMQKILQSPFTLHEGLLEKTRREITFAREGKPARIIAKMNALIEPQIILTLYQAAMAGVKVDLIVRGICALRPGIRGISENITVRSIVGRFLEHSRVYYFHNDGSPEIFCASADWMERNFFRRIEVCFPIERKQHRDRIVEDLETYLADNEHAWVLKADGRYERASSVDVPGVSAQ